MGLPQKEPSKILEDNKLAIALTKNPGFHYQSKNIDTHYHYIRKYIARKYVQSDMPMKQEDCSKLRSLLGVMKNQAYQGGLGSL